MSDMSDEDFYQEDFEVVLVDPPPNINEELENSNFDLLPAKSRILYERCYKTFTEWKKSSETKSSSERVLMAYFLNLSKKYKPSTLWSHYSMLKTTIKTNERLDISTYRRLSAFIKKRTQGLQSKKSKVFSSKEVEKFLTEAPDDKYLLTKRLSYTHRGYVVPVLTPFLDDSRRTLNLSLISHYAKYLAARGVTGVLINGTSGEGPALLIEERKSIAEAWAHAVQTTGQHLMIQVGGAQLPYVLEMAEHAESIGADAILCLPELYFRPKTPQQLIEYLEVVGQAAPRTPLLYYHTPAMSNVNINMPQFLQSIGNRLPTFVGIKFTSTDLEEGMQAVHVNNKEFLVLLGNDQIMAGAFSMGMDSAVPTTVNLAPELAVELLKAGTSGDSARARKMQEQFSKLVITISKYGEWVETMKVAMRLLTPIDVGPSRFPLTPLSDEKVASMTEDLKALGYTVLE